MKKMLVMILALAMVLSMSVFAFATDVTTNGDTDSEVKVTINDNDKKVYKVEIKWEELAFTYTMGDWNPNTHEYGQAKWSAAKTISIINHSNAAVTAQAKYVAGASALDNVTITLLNTSGNTTLESAADVAFGSANVNDTTRENSIVYSLSASGNPQEAANAVVVGKVTVTIGGITTP